MAVVIGVSLSDGERNMNKKREKSIKTRCERNIGVEEKKCRYWWEREKLSDRELKNKKEKSWL